MNEKVEVREKQELAAKALEELAARLRNGEDVAIALASVVVAPEGFYHSSCCLPGESASKVQLLMVTANLDDLHRKFRKMASRAMSTEGL